MRSVPRWIRCAVIAGLVAGVPRTGAAGPPAPAAVSDSVAAGWSQRLQQSDRVTVKYTTYRRTPAPFKTRLPCAYRDDTVRERTFAGEGAARLIATLGLDRHPLSAAWCDRFPCPEPPDRSTYSMELDFGEDDRLLSMGVRFATGGATVHDPTGRWACHRIADGGRSLRGFLAETFKDDTLLALVPVCDPDAAQAGAGFGLEQVPMTGALVEELPEITKKVAPDYPEAARKAGASGTVMVMALVGTDGGVRETMIVRSRSLELDGAAARAVERWRFRPATVGGSPRAVWVAIPVKFSL